MPAAGFSIWLTENFLKFNIADQQTCLRNMSSNESYRLRMSCCCCWKLWAFCSCQWRTPCSSRMYLMASFRISLLLNFLSAGCVGRSRRKSAKAPLTFCCRNRSRWLEKILRPPPPPTTTLPPPRFEVRIPDDVAEDEDRDVGKPWFGFDVFDFWLFSLAPKLASSSSSLLNPETNLNFKLFWRQTRQWSLA